MEKRMSEEDEDMGNSSSESSSDSDNKRVGFTKKTRERREKVRKKPAGLFHTKKLRSVTIGMVRKGKFHLNVATLMSEDEDEEDNVIQNEKVPSPESPSVSKSNESPAPIKSLVSRFLGLGLDAQPQESPHSSSTKFRGPQPSQDEKCIPVHIPTPLAQAAAPVKKVEFLITPDTSMQMTITNTSTLSISPKTLENKDGLIDNKKKIHETGSQETLIRRSRTPKGHMLSEIRKMTLAAQDAIEEKKRKRLANERALFQKPSKKNRVMKRTKRLEEEYTDKDRAAAVTFGYRDIKLSLRELKQRERKLRMTQDLLSSEQFVSSMLVVEATFQMKTKKEAASSLPTLDKVLKLRPLHKEALVARSQCHLKLGDPTSSLRDAETLLSLDATDIHGLFQYAESLFQLGQFEKALIAYHQGHRLRKHMESFRIGIQKSQETIRRAIGDRSATKIGNIDDILSLINKMDAEAHGNESEGGWKTPVSDVSLESGARDVTAENEEKVELKSTSLARWVSREVLGQMFWDKEYFLKFIKRPDIQSEDYNSSAARASAIEAIQYLEMREQFWRQQNPIYSRKPKNYTFEKL